MIDAPRLPRRRRMVPAVIVALVVAAGGITVVIDVISVALNNRSLVWPYRQMAAQMRQTQWSDIPIIAISAAAVFVGILLLAAAAVPGRPKLVPLTSDQPGESAATTRRSIGRALRRAVEDIDGIDNVEVRLRRRHVRLKVGSPLRDPGNLEHEAHAAALDRLAQIRLSRPPKVTIRIRHRPDD